jgi:acetyl esterase/lipase
MNRTLLLLIVLINGSLIFGQENPVLKYFPKGTVLHSNIAYNNDTIQKHLLDIYLPSTPSKKMPLVIFIHGGGWLSNDKYADMGYMKNTVSEIVNKGYALASIDYRWSTQAVFPAQAQDCNKAIGWLYDNANKYGFDRSNFVLMGFSAGGHLASLIGLSNNNNINEFIMPGSKKAFAFKGVIDFYGPADLMLFPRNDDPTSPESILIGATPLSRPDLSKKASPINYVDKNDPPFLIIHGEKDDMVSPKQSQLLSSWLNVHGVQNELIIVKDAPHYGDMFDTPELRNRVMNFLESVIK